MNYLPIVTLLGLSPLFHLLVQAIPAAITARALLPELEKRESHVATSVDRKVSRSYEVLATNV